MRARGILFAMVGALLLGPIGPVNSVHAQFSPDDAKCRKAIGNGTRKLVNTMLKAQTKCHKDRMSGKILPAVDCNDIATLPAEYTAKVVKAEQKLSSIAVKKCEASTTAFLGFQVCPDPCGTNPGHAGNVISSNWSSVSNCLICVAKDRVKTMLTDGFGSPPTPGMTSPESSCQNLVGKAITKYAVKRFQEQGKCQYSEDLAKIPATDCQTADLKMGIAKALAKADGYIAKCEVGAFTGLSSCGSDIASEQACIEANSVTAANDLFVNVYFPPAPTPTPSVTATPTSTPTSTPTVTPTRTDTPTSTPTYTPTRTHVAANVVFVSKSRGCSICTCGTISQPCITIQAGIDRASALFSTEVCVDADTYNESITLSGSIRVRGGFGTGPDWAPNFGFTTIDATASTTGVLGTNVNSILDRLVITSGNAGGSGNSSYGVRLLGTSAVTITNSTITAGTGSAGTAGGNGSNGSGGSNGGNGGNGCGNSSYWCATCGAPSPGTGAGGVNCTSGTSGGGGGGGATADSGCGSNGSAGAAASTGAGGGGGGARGCENGAGSAGGTGTAGATGSNGAGGSSFGSGGNTYVVSSGGTGGIGGNGGGGGGGGGGGYGSTDCDSYGGAGGGGSSGGCGGTATTPGTGGGGSFGIWLASTSTASVTSTTITTANGGAAGAAGATRGSGGGGGFRGSGGSGFDGSGAGGNGGTGGSGGQGGCGGGGGGGPSVGIFCTAAGAATCASEAINVGSGGGGGSSCGNAGSAGLATRHSNCNASCS